jgi:hypothetical protein
MKRWTGTPSQLRGRAPGGYNFDVFAYLYYRVFGA